jgi:GTP-binding protein
MHIKSAEFIKGIIGSDSILDQGIPQIAFVGRSNVGKSSIINILTGAKKLAISSSTPGRTMQLNFFLINKKVFFVDLPGYGYAVASMQQSEKMRQLIEWYLMSAETSPDKVVLVIDSKVGPTQFDLDMLELLRKNNHNIIIVANKIDKIKPSEIEKKKRSIVETLQILDIIYFSSKTKKGRNELLARIMD